MTNKVLMKKRNGQFVQVSQAEADKLIETGHAVKYDLKTGRHEPFKPFKLEKKEKKQPAETTGKKPKKQRG